MTIQPLQRSLPGHYVSGLLYDRFQIVESARHRFAVVDFRSARNPDGFELLRQPALHGRHYQESDLFYFGELPQAQAYVQECAKGNVKFGQAWLKPFRLYASREPDYPTTTGEQRIMEVNLPAVFKYRGKPPPSGLPTVIATDYNKHEGRIWFLTDTIIGQTDYPAIVVKGLQLADFTARYEPSDDNLQAAASLLFEHLRAYGSTELAHTTLSRLLPQNQTEGRFPVMSATTTTNTAVEKKNRVVAAKSAKKLDDAIGPKPGKKAKTAVAPVAEKPAKKGKTAAKPAPAFATEPKPTRQAKPSAEPKPSVSKTMRALIMAGKMTDDEIFAETQRQFPALDDGKRSYVAWYRNDLKKLGQNPPGPIAENGVAASSNGGGRKAKG